MKILKPREAAELVKDGDCIVTDGFVGSCCPETLTTALEKRFLETGKPINLNLMYAAAQGNQKGKGYRSFCTRRND